MIRELLEEISPKDYKGSRPPQKSYEKAIAGLELLAFSWWSPRCAKQMYIKFVLKNERYYYVSLHQSDHIRLKCDEAYAELNALEVHWKSQSSDIYSGNRPFCLELFKQAVRYLIGFTKSPLFLNKALFYADFKHFQQHGMSITGARYVHLEYGPCPDQFQNIYQLFLSKKILISGGHHILKSIDMPDLSVFSDSEKEVLEFVAKISHIDGGKKLLKISHDEAAFKKTEPLQLISYEFSKELKI